MKLEFVFWSYCALMLADLTFCSILVIASDIYLLSEDSVFVSDHHHQASAVTSRLCLKNSILKLGKLQTGKCWQLVEREDRVTERQIKLCSGSHLADNASNQSFPEFLLQGEDKLGQADSRACVVRRPFTVTTFKEDLFLRYTEFYLFRVINNRWQFSL